MQKYTIYQPNNEFKYFFEKYKQAIYFFDEIKENNSFYSNQLENVFEATKHINEQLYMRLNQRSDYTYKNNIHTITNKLTSEIYKCIVNEYSIEIYASKKSNIFFDILCKKQKNCVIIEKHWIK